MKWFILCSTKNPNINIERVAKRVSEGGHDVPNDKIISHYHRARDLFKDVLEVADKSYVYDNSNKYDYSWIEVGNKFMGFIVDYLSNQKINLGSGFIH